MDAVGRALIAAIHPAGRTAVVLFVVAIPVFLVTTNVRWVINMPALYSYNFDKYDIPTVTGIERNELLKAAEQIRDYFNNDQEFLDVRVVQRGIRHGLYNEREILHMRDVKGLVQRVYSGQMASMFYMIAFVVVGLAIYRRSFLVRLARFSSLGGAVAFGLVVLVGLASIVGFDRLFLAFHLASFSNDLWQLDPSRDYLLAMFPQGFFFDATMLIAIATVAEAVLVSLLVVVLLRWRFWKCVGTARAAKCPTRRTAA